MFTFGAEMIEIFDDPLSDTFFMKYVPAWEQNTLFHIFIADSTG